MPDPPRDAFGNPVPPEPEQPQQPAAPAGGRGGSPPPQAPDAPPGATDAPSAGGAYLPPQAPDAPASGTAAPGRTPGQATAALALGVLSVLFCPLLGPVAVSLATNAKRQLAQDPTLGGSGLARAGFVLGIIGSLFLALMVVVFVVGIVDGIDEP